MRGTDSHCDISDLSYRRTRAAESAVGSRLYVSLPTASEARASDGITRQTCASLCTFPHRRCTTPAAGEVSVGLWSPQWPGGLSRLYNHYVQVSAGPPPDSTSRISTAFLHTACGVRAAGWFGELLRFQLLTIGATATVLTAVRQLKASQISDFHFWSISGNERMYLCNLTE